MQNSIVMFTFSFSAGNTLFGTICSKKLKLSVEAEIWYLDQFEYAEFNDAVQFFVFERKCSFWGKFGPKSQSYQFKAKFASYNLLGNIFGIK